MELLGDLPELEMEAGKAVIREGQPVNNLYILKEGEVEITMDRTPVCRISEKGTVLGEVSSLLSGTATASVITSKPSRLLVIEDSREFLKRNNEALFLIARILAERVDRLTRDYVDELDDNDSSYWRYRV